MKHYMAAAHGRHARAGRLLDLGCGSGHDIRVLARHEIHDVVGVDRSGVMLNHAREHTARPLVQALAEHLPFRDGSFAACWIERVLMHVADPNAVLAEVVRCLEPEGVLTIFEPDWSSLVVNGWHVPAAWATTAKHPSIGTELGALLPSHGCFIRDRVEERSWWTYPQFESLMSAALSRVTSDAVRSWLEEIRSSAQRGEFMAEMVKVMWVATAPPR